MIGDYNMEAATPIIILSQPVLDRAGHIRQALFDFDGTLSLLRQGWETVMAPYMVSVICGVHPPPPGLEGEVADYIDCSTGILTIRQMEWLAEAVERHGLAGQPLNPMEYKRGYLARLHQHIKGRKKGLQSGEIEPVRLLLNGTVQFLTALAQSGVQLYLASGSDHPEVVQEAGLLGLSAYFQGRIFGALDIEEMHDKERLVGRILVENDLHGEELLVVGDGPVEIRAARRYAAITLGVASDEVAGQGWNQRKARRLAEAGAEILVADFRPWQKLIDLFIRRSP